MLFSVFTFKTILFTYTYFNRKSDLRMEVNANGLNISQTSKSTSVITEDFTNTSNFNGYFLTDTDKIVVETICEKLIEDLEALIKKINSQQQNSSNLADNKRKKELLKGFIFSDEQNNEMQLNQLENQIVKVIFKL